MALKWSFRRQFLYYSVAAVILLVLALAAYIAFFTAAPTCFDGKQNGNETGADCGGGCALLCTQESRAPVVRWARAFRTSSQTYTAAVYVQNPNQGAGAAAVPYTLQLFDDRNLLVVEIEGSLDIPPVQTVPVVVPNINVGTRTVSRTLFTFTEEPAWRKTGPLPVLRIQNQRLSADGSRLSAAVYNDSNSEARDAVAAAVLFDSQGIARAASLSRIQSIARKAAQEVVFTWSGGVPDIVRAEITVLPPL